MVLFLVENVPAKSLHVRGTHAEQPVAVLPMKSREIIGKRLDEFRRVFLEKLQDLHRRRLLCEIAQDVHMVFNPADGYRTTFQVLENPRLVRPKALPNGFRKPWTAFLGGKNHVNAQNVQRLRHSGRSMAAFGVPFQGEKRYGGQVSGAPLRSAPAYYGGRPFGLDVWLVRHMKRAAAGDAWAQMPLTTRSKG